ncbi:MAG TPA: hemerythrin domain-containing protein [Accumulibacter sp.]|uniref:hemerythrin domain-containing protein n=1 Tax=Accumulibacter sp. TaxID=2053492 RepID=UPI002BB7B32B|nr:hemerythrin domain-containing protein [Accumulibacter sp.]HRF71950.1 hemerythrin domain-containing protein [Accumulibacter sp.]
MTFMKWSRHFVTGIDLVDGQHRGLVDLVNDVAPLLSRGEPLGAAAADALLDRLSEYAQTHFRDEERLMREGGLEDSCLDLQARSHRAFVQEVALMRRQVAADEQIDGQLLLRFLANWLTVHLLTDDQLMARQLALIASGHTPAEAATLARETKEDTAQTVLADALIDLYAVVAERNRKLVEANVQLQAARAKLVEANAGLAQQVDERSRELAATNADLLREQGELQRAIEAIERTQGRLLQSEKGTAVGQLAAGVAHEIDKPVGIASLNLASLKDYVERLLATIDATAPAVAALARHHPARLAAEQAWQDIELDYLRQDIPDLIRDSADGLARVRKIVTDLKDFSHREEAEWQNADLNHGLERALKMVWNEPKDKVEVVRDFGELPAVRCLPAQINQVFVHLLVNAGQAIATAGTITLRTGQQGRYAWVEVEDTGGGMPPAVQERIFEPFFTSRAVGQGSGLGLAIASEIVQRHHGTISVDSQPGRGSRFRVLLPIAGPAGETRP